MSHMDSDSKITVRATLESTRRGSDYHDVEVSRAEWEAMTEDERDAFMQPYIDVLIENNVSGGYYVRES